MRQSEEGLVEQVREVEVKTVESLVALGLRTSKRDEYAFPPAKPVSGMLSGFTLDPP